MSGTLDQITSEIFLRCHTVTYHCAAHTEKAVDYVYEIVRCDTFRHTFLTLHCTPTTAGESSHFFFQHDKREDIFCWEAD